MKTFEELHKIKYGDLLELKHAGDMTVGRVILVHEHKWYPSENKIIMRTLIPDLAHDGHITWTFQILQTLLIRVIDDPQEILLLRLLYD